MSAETIDTSGLLAHLPRKPLPDIPEVLVAMGNIQTELEAAGLPHVIHFNAVYRELTGAVQDGIESGGTFLQPDTVRRTVGIFAQLYFDPLRAHAEACPQVIPDPWRHLFYNRAARGAPDGIQFLLGMNAHINYDLPQALCASKVDQDYYPDYTNVVGALIQATARELSRTYLPVPNISRDALRGVTVRTIAQWRETAWRAGNSLQFTHDDPELTRQILKKLEVSADRKSRLITPIGSLVINTLSLASRGNRVLQEVA